MKNTPRVAFALIALIAGGQSFAEECYVHAVVSSADRKVGIVLDVVRVKINQPFNSPGKLNLNQANQDDLRARALDFTKRNLKRVEGKSIDPDTIFKRIGLTYGDHCFEDAAGAEGFRDINLKSNDSVLHGNWSEGGKPVQTQNAPTAAKNNGPAVKASNNSPTLTGVPADRKATAASKSGAKPAVEKKSDSTVAKTPPEQKVYKFKTARTIRTPNYLSEEQARNWVKEERAKLTSAPGVNISSTVIGETPVSCKEGRSSGKVQCEVTVTWNVESHFNPEKGKAGPSKTVAR